MPRHCGSDSGWLRPADATGSRIEPAIGLHHVAFNIGTTMDELREAKAKLDAAGIATTPVDHDVTKPLYLADTDGNGIEVYVDASDAWRREPQRVAQAKPLEI
jgi:catechol 2,3-dioxygenase